MEGEVVYPPYFLPFGIKETVCFFFLPNNLFLDFKLKNSLIIERDRDVPGAALGPVLPLPPTSIEWKDRLFGWVYGRDERILRMTFSANGSRHGG